MITSLPLVKRTRKWGNMQSANEDICEIFNPRLTLVRSCLFVSVREFVEKAFAVVGTTIKWVGPTGTVDEIGVDAADESRVLIKIDPRYFRPTEVDLLLGDPTKAKNVIGWVAKTPFAELVREMVEADVAMLSGEIVDTDRMKT